MNKTFTAAIAITAVAGLASAAIETAPAGYIDKDAEGSTIQVCNPFYSFGAGENTTLADIDGENIGNSKYIGIVAPSGSITKYFWKDGHWYTDTADASTLSDNVPLIRGDAIVFQGATGYPLVISGLLTNATVSAKSQNEIGYKLVGNASAVDKHLSDFTVGGNYDPNYDYVQLGSTKYVYKNGGWKIRETGLAPDSDPVVESGQGLFLYCQTTRARKTTINNGGSLGVTISVPDDAE